MKVACLVNNYQYGEARFEKMRKQYAYQDEQIDDNHHVVFLDVDEDGFSFLKSLLKSELHNNVNKKSGFSERGWVELYKQRLHPRVTEDIEAEEDNDPIIPDEAFSYMSEAHLSDGSPFYIIWDSKRLKEVLGIPGEDDSAAEELYDLFFDKWHWGYEDQFYMCDGCGLALDSYNDPYVWLDSGVYCEDCVRNDDYAAEEYLEKCFYENGCNYIIPDDRLNELGWHLACDEGWIDDMNHSFERCHEFAEQWGGMFIVSYSGWRRYEIWTDNVRVTPENIWGEPEEEEEEEEDGQGED